MTAGPLAKQMDYWRQNLRGPLPVLQLPFDRPRPSLPSYRGSMETFSLSGPLTEALKTFSRKEGLTLYMTLLAAFKALLHRYSGQEDIIIGGVTDTRRRPELQKVVGYFLNSLVLRSKPQGRLRFRDYLAQVGDAVVGALSASDVPFDRIVRDIQPKRELARASAVSSAVFDRAAGAGFRRWLGSDPDGRDRRRVQIRSLSRTGRAARGHDRAVSVQHRAVRRADHPADDRALAHRSGGGRRRSGLPAGALAAVDAGRERAAADKVERYGGGNSARDHPSAFRGSGSAQPARHGGRMRRQVLELSGTQSPKRTPWQTACAARAPRPARWLRSASSALSRCWSACWRF